MPLFLNNEDVAQVLTMKTCMEALEVLYGELGAGKAVAASAHRHTFANVGGFRR